MAAADGLSLRTPAVRLGRDDLLEAFLAYCRQMLLEAEAAPAVAYLVREVGVARDRLPHLPIGYYPGRSAVRDHLRSLGFTAAEVDRAKLAGDPRLAGRLIVPWRDWQGRVQTVAALACAREGAAPERLYWQMTAAVEEPFGLSEALAPRAGGREILLLVDDLLEVLYFHAAGRQNVAALGRGGLGQQPEFWQRLADAGVRSVTLALADDAAGRARTAAAIRAAAFAERSPEVFAVAPGSFGRAVRAATFARLSRPERFDALISRRHHGFRTAAEIMVLAHRGEEGWTDERLLALLHAAIDFDREVFRPHRALTLNRFFWPTILDATGADWDAVLPELQRRCHPQSRPRALALVTPSMPWCDDSAAVVPLETEAPAAPAPLPARGVAAAGSPGAAVPAAAMGSPCPPPTSDDVQRTAYFLWEQRGRPEGAQLQCWLDAEAMLARRRPHAA